MEEEIHPAWEWVSVALWAVSVVVGLGFAATLAYYAHDVPDEDDEENEEKDEEKT